MNEQIPMSYDIDKLLGKKGHVKGVAFKTDAQYIMKNFGSEKLKLVQQRTKEMGYEIEYDKIGKMKWYPVGTRPLSLIAIAEVLDFSEEDIKKMGESAPKTSFITRLLLRHIVSMDTLTASGPDYWLKHWNIGKLVIKRTGYSTRRIALNKDGTCKKCGNRIIGNPVKVVIRQD